MEETLTIINLILFVVPSIYFFIYEVDEIQLSKRGIYFFLLVYLSTLLLFYGIQTIIGIYLRIFTNILFMYISVILLFTTIILILRLVAIEFNTRIYISVILLYFISFLFILYHMFFADPIIPDPITPENAFPILIILIISAILPLIILGGSYLYIRRYEKRTEIPEKDLKQLIYYFSIALVVFFIFSIIAFSLSFKMSLVFAGQDDISFGDIPAIISAVFNSVLNDPLFIFTAIFTMFGALVRVFGIPAVRLIGNLIMGFMPMLMWLIYVFGDVPEIIIILFGDFEIFARVFHILLSTMMIVIVLSAWNMFTGIIMLQTT